MRAFISYSLNDEDLYILSLLARELRNKGLGISQSSDFKLPINELTKININKSQLFIGLITSAGAEQERVIQEFWVAASAGLPTVLLVDRDVQFPSFQGVSPVVFDRSNPQAAIDRLNRFIESNKPQNNSDWDTDKIAKIIGGAALIALIGRLAKEV